MREQSPFLVAAWLALTGLAMQGTAQVAPNPAEPVPAPQMPAQQNQVRPEYVIGSGDQMLIEAKDVEEINQKTFRVETDGTLTLPLIGSVQATGRTVAQLEGDITEKLKALFQNPQVRILMTVFRQDVVTFLGAFQKPGIVALEGRQTLVDMLLRVGGLMPNASRYIRLTRRLEAGPIPLPGAIEDPVAKTSTVDISVGSLSDTVNPAQDIVLLPYDVITVSKAEKIYVSGALGKTGTVELDEHESLSVLQVLTAMGGLSAEAEPSKAVILRPVLNTARRAAIPIDLTQILATKTNDFPLMPNDILVVPGHKQKKFGDVVWKILPFVTGIIFYIIARYV